MSAFAVVEFVDDKSVECIPSSWLDSGKSNAYWPDMISRSKLVQFIKKGQIPEKNWKQFAVRVMSNAGMLVSV